MRRYDTHTHTHTHTHTQVQNGILLSHKKNNICHLHSNMGGLGGITPRERSPTEKDKYCMISLKCDLKSITNGNITKKQIHRYREQTSDY